MLQQILQDMFVDEELLAELSDDQKQILFFKMREEQVRRWKEREKEFAQKPPPIPKKSKKRKQLQWCTGTDGEVWVWVMGYHKDDKPYQILLEEARQGQARQMAEVEIKRKRLEDEKEDARIHKQEEERQKRLMEEEKELETKKKQLELERRKTEEAALYATLKEAKLQQEKIDRERKEAEQRENDLRKKEKAFRLQKEKRAKANQEKEKIYQRQLKERTEDLYMSISQVKGEQMQMAAQEKSRVEEMWQVQLKRIKKADKDRSQLARRAREEVRMSRMSMDLSEFSIDAFAPRPQRAQKTKRPKKPTSRQEVISWFKEEELPKGSGLNPVTKKPAEWFHGIISRKEAEEILTNKQPGAYLVRVSERVWGYALSFKDTEKIKHFLIDAADRHYQFFGTDQILHDSLHKLIQYHRTSPISFSGQEFLKSPVGQVKSPPDHQELLQ